MCFIIGALWIYKAKLAHPQCQQFFVSYVGDSQEYAEKENQFTRVAVCFVCVFVTCAVVGKKESKRRVCPLKKLMYTFMLSLSLVWVLKDSFSCLSCTLVEAIMGSAVVQITLFGLLLALVIALPNKVRSQNLKQHVPKKFNLLNISISYHWLLNIYLMIVLDIFVTAPFCQLQHIELCLW